MSLININVVLILIHFIYTSQVLYRTGIYIKKFCGCFTVQGKKKEVEKVRS
jgi:hypothetical protein